jgi:hypothetical protein
MSPHHVFLFLICCSLLLLSSPSAFLGAHFFFKFSSTLPTQDLDSTYIYVSTYWSRDSCAGGLQDETWSLISKSHMRLNSTGFWGIGGGILSPSQKSRLGEILILYLYVLGRVYLVFLKIGVGYNMAWKWIRISLKSWMVSWWCWYKNKIVQARVSNCMHQCLKCVCTKRTHSRVPGLKGEALFSELFLSANCRWVQICISISLSGRWILDVSSICLSEAAVHQKIL